MRKTIIASALVLAFVASAYAETTDWPPQREKESVFTDRKLEVFKHGVRPEWGYAAPQRDTFWCCIRRRRIRTHRFTLCCIPPVMT